MAMQCRQLRFCSMIKSRSIQSCLTKALSKLPSAFKMSKLWSMFYKPRSTQPSVLLFLEVSVYRCLLSIHLGPLPSSWVKKRCTYMWICSLFIHVCIYIRTYVYMWTMHICMYVCTYIHVDICVCMYIHVCE